MTLAFPASVSFRTGAVRTREIGYLLAEDDEVSEDEVQHTVILTWHNAKWFKHFLSWSAKSACICQIPKEQLIAIGGDGDYVIFGQGDIFEGKIWGDVDRADKVGPFRSVQNICGKAYAVGMDRLAYRRDGHNLWTRLDNGLPPGGNLEAIHGFAEDDIYAVGWAGEIWHFNGWQWSQNSTPTNVILTGVCCAGDGKVYCCGQKGTLIVGRGEEWDLIPQPDTQADLWDVEWFKGKLYISTMMVVYALVTNRLVLVGFGKEEVETAYHLSSVDGVMWSIGQKDVLAYDGSAWKRIE